jgi:putative transposase
MMVAYIDAHRDAHGIEPICALLPIAPSTYWRHKAQQTDPTRRSARVQWDDALKREIEWVWHEHEQVYGAEKVWRQLRGRRVRVARIDLNRDRAGPRSRQKR